METLKQGYFAHHAQKNRSILGKSTLKRWLQGGVLIIKNGVGGNDSMEGGAVDMEEDFVEIAIVHSGDCIRPSAALYFSHYNWDSSIENAYEILETATIENLSNEDMEEMYKTENETGFNPQTETFDGAIFQMTPNEFKEIIESIEGPNKLELSIIEFWEEEEEEEEEE